MKTSKAIITFFFTVLSIPLFGQIEECTTLIDTSSHGHIGLELGCDDPLLITTQVGESIVIDGEFITKGGIRIVAGASGSIRITEPDHPKDYIRGQIRHNITHFEVPPPSSNRFANFNTSNVVQVSPNPATDELTLNYSKNIQSVQLYNAFGVIIQEEIIRKPAQEVKMSIGRQKDGLYSLRIITSDGRVHSKNIIKN